MAYLMKTYNTSLKYFLPNQLSVVTLEQDIFQTQYILIKTCITVCACLLHRHLASKYGMRRAQSLAKTHLCLRHIAFIIKPDNV